MAARTPPPRPSRSSTRRATRRSPRRRGPRGVSAVAERPLGRRAGRRRCAGELPVNGDKSRLPPLAAARRGQRRARRGRAASAASEDTRRDAGGRARARRAGRRGPRGELHGARRRAARAAPSRTASSTCATPARCCGCCRACWRASRRPLHGRRRRLDPPAARRSHRRSAARDGRRRRGTRTACRRCSCAPGAPLTGIEYELPVASAQVKSCLLLAGLLAEGPTTVVEPRRQPRPHRADAAGGRRARRAPARPRDGAPADALHAARGRGAGRHLLGGAVRRRRDAAAGVAADRAQRRRQPRRAAAC